MPKFFWIGTSSIFPGNRKPGFLIFLEETGEIEAN